MYSRLLAAPKEESIFLFGPRGTGKSSWVQSTFPKANYINLLEDATFTELLASPGRLETRIANSKEYTILDEVQKVPALLDEVHRLIESKGQKFVLTGSSARKLRRGAGNLLAGRALTRKLYPLTTLELGQDFNLHRALSFGTLPRSIKSNKPKDFLKSYISTYLKEEIQAEGLTRNLAGFARFLEAASFSQGQVLNSSGVGQDAHLNQKVTESYFEILEDLLLARRIPVFTRRAKRKIVAHPKFYFFDVGVFNTLRPRGPLDSDAEIQGASLESLVIQDFIAINDYKEWEYESHYWRTHSKLEVDFVFYGPRGLKAVEVTRSAKLRDDDFRALEAFHEDYPEAKCYLVWGGSKAISHKFVKVIPAMEWFGNYSDWF
ncbi:MAG: ATP-binding protein [Deltaproteobacteria bacterium]|nr:ATP-binding protein [Deltaproteobacteria bacterium]MBI3295691.1 ATP-binding protein [Deltaproteobacteria bacterium]